MIGINSFCLHIIGMIFMTFDHLWGTVLSQYEFLTWIGRISFPIFAFLIVEGDFHTSNFKKYALRILIFAIISEIPFNLMYSSSIIFPFHQNVLWTFLIGLLCINKIEKTKKKGNILLTIIIGIIFSLLGYVIALITMTDYMGNGILMMLVFYFFHGKGIINKIGQLIGIVIINCYLMKGLSIPVTIGNFAFNLRQQSIAIFSLIPIWLYNGKQGKYNKVIKYLYYTYYPLHILILYLLTYLI